MIPSSTSVSQVELHRLCKRRWRFRHVEKLPDPPAESAIRGTDCHEEIKLTLLGTPAPGPYDIYVRALAMRGFFPKPGIEQYVEQRFRMDTHVDGLPLNGVVDLLSDGYDWPGDEHGPLPTLKDWKTTSDLYYAKKPDEVLRDIQLGTYGEFAYREGLQSEKIRVGLIYIEVPSPKKPQPKTPEKVKIVPVFHVVDQTHVRRLWDSMRPDIDRMIQDAALPDPNDVEPNPLACGKFQPNGCPFKAQCGVSQLTNLSRIAPRTKEKKMGFFSDTNKSKNGNGQAAAPAATQAPPPVQQKAAPAKGGFLGQVREKQATAAAPAPVEVVHQGARIPVPTPGQVVPNDAPPRDSTEPLEAGDPGAKKVGRPKGAKNKPKEAESETEQQIEEREEAPVAAAKTGRRSFILYVGCYPTKRPQGELEPTLAEDWVGPALMELHEYAATENEAHFMRLPFGPQKAAWDLAIMKHITKGLPSSIVVSGDLVRGLLPLLIPYATTVIRPFRE